MTSQTLPPIIQPKRLIPVTKWNNHHEWPTEYGLRWLIFNADINGFDKVVVRVQNRVLIDEAAFFAWVAENNKRRSV
jgi:hypothetical protein